MLNGKETMYKGVEEKQKTERRKVLNLARIVFANLSKNGPGRVPLYAKDRYRDSCCVSRVKHDGQASEMIHFIV